ncbi:MAG: serine/threonine-protein kinase [Pirellulales bacterium]
MMSSKNQPQTNTANKNAFAKNGKNCDHCHVWREIINTEADHAIPDELLRIAESCPSCQSEIQQLSNTDVAWWNEAKQSWLESELPCSTASDQSNITLEFGPTLDDSAIDVDRISLEFLGPPTHPELLGRLGRYDILKVIGKGGMGVVLKAFDNELHRMVAIKILADHLASNSSARRRFAREAQAAAAVIHHNVIPIYNVESEEKFPYLVMQFVGGGSLQGKVECEGPLSVESALRIAKQTAAALLAAHEQGLVHRDVKPANILLDENVERVLLSDFGLARAVDDASFTRTGIVAGTPHYMSPEQAIGDAIGCSSDQFSLGSVIYFMLTGHSPFRATTAMGVLNRICQTAHRPLNQVNPSVPIEVCKLVDRLLAKRPEDRFESVNQVELQIDKLLFAIQSGKLSLRLPFGTRVARSVSGLNRMSKTMVATLLLTVIGIAVWPWMFSLTKMNTQEPQGEITVRSSSDLTVRELRKAQQQFEQYLQEDTVFQRETEHSEKMAQELEQSWRRSSIQPNVPVPAMQQFNDISNELGRMERQLKIDNPN